MQDRGHFKDITSDYNNRYSQYLTKSFFNFFVIYPIYTVRMDDCDFGAPAHKYGYSFNLDGFILSLKIGAYVSTFNITKNHLKNIPKPPGSNKLTENYVCKIKNKNPERISSETRNYNYKRYYLRKIGELSC